MKGKVAWWNEERGYGCFIGPGIDGELFAHRNDFLNREIDHALIESEPVEFDIEEIQGRKQAVRIRRLDEDLRDRFEGVVKTFDRKRGTGWIAREDDSDIFVHWSDIIDQRKIKFLAPEEEVEFSIGRDEAGRTRAIYVTHDTRPILMQFADLNDFTSHLRRLAELAEPEVWSFKDDDPDDYSILNHYIMNVFRRSRFEARRLERFKVVEKELGNGRRAACFNTGLVTQYEEEIFGFFSDNRSRDPRAPEWYLEGFCVRSDLKLSAFDRLPERASFVENPSELIYDWHRDLRVRKDHVSNRLSRLSPDAMSELTRRGQSVMEAIDLAKDEAVKRVRRDYKVAVPQFYRGEVQLLLPLCIITKHKADVALVVERHEEAYYGNTILTLEQAYFNSRLIARPDSEWLRSQGEISKPIAPPPPQPDPEPVAEEPAEPNIDDLPPYPFADVDEDDDSESADLRGVPRAEVDEVDGDDQPAVEPESDSAEPSDAGGDEDGDDDDNIGNRI